MLAFAAHAIPDGDRIQLPARSSSLAAHSLLLDVADAGDRLVAVGERGHILYSEDRGESWQQAEVPARVTLTAVAFPTPELGWAVGHDGIILHSRDSGRTWERQLDGFALNDRIVEYRQSRVNELEAALAQPEVGADADLLEERLDEALFALEDAQYALEDGPNKPLLDVWFANARHGWAVGAYGLVLETRDGGRQWAPRMADLDNPDGYHLNAVAGVGEALYLAGEQGLLFRSLDAGRSFEWLQSPYAGSLFAVAPVDGALLLLGMRGRAFRSADQGRTWQAVTTDTQSTLNAVLDLPGGRVLVVGQRGTLLLSEDGGRRFQAYTDPQRRAYLGAAQGRGEAWVLFGQGGVRHLRRDELVEVAP
ncbi:YCF48-related protein [Motiliproteus sp. SC1-56]|uniref:WD40/YVTN/BNR-like repeat-containing protein n=1 Tax=Motiliproteus sp. SC1-56 TaxID=2799565 RepID=UPI001A8E1C32|nr:YCF48-related protein [Motiliproteus sp. SC1-56]